MAKCSEMQSSSNKMDNFLTKWKSIKNKRFQDLSEMNVELEDITFAEPITPRSPCHSATDFEQARLADYKFGIFKRIRNKLVIGVSVFYY